MCLCDFGFALTTASTWAAVGRSLMLSMYLIGVAGYLADLSLLCPLAFVSVVENDPRCTGESM